VRVQLIRAGAGQFQAQELELADGATVADALAATALPREGLAGYAVYGERVGPEAVLAEATGWNCSSRCWPTPRTAAAVAPRCRRRVRGRAEGGWKAGRPTRRSLPSGPGPQAPLRKRGAGQAR